MVDSCISMDEIKLLEVVPKYKLAGAERMAESLILGMHERGVHVEAVSLYDFDSSIVESLRAAGVPYYSLMKRPGFDPVLPGRLLRLFRNTRATVVHTHIYAAKYATLAARMTASCTACLHTVHSVADQELSDADKKVQALFYKWGWSVPVAITPQVRRTVCDIYGLDENNVPMVYNGVTRRIPEEVEVAALRDSSRFTFLHIGRYEDVKNHSLLLDAFSEVYRVMPSVRLVLLGRGELYNDIAAKIAALGLAGSIEQVGEVADVTPYLAAADAFVLPSKFEGFPITLIEAMGAGLPCVCTAVGGVPDVVEDGSNGLLTEVDTHAFARAMATVALDGALRRRMAARALERSELYSRDSMVDGYYSLIEGIVGRARG